MKILLHKQQYSSSHASSSSTLAQPSAGGLSVGRFLARSLPCSAELSRSVIRNQKKKKLKRREDFFLFYFGRFAISVSADYIKWVQLAFVGGCLCVLRLLCPGRDIYVIQTPQAPSNPTRIFTAPLATSPMCN